MILYFITDSRFARSNESIYNLNGSLGDTLWARYLEHFERVVVVARMLQNAPINKNAPGTTDPRVSFVEIPYFVGPFQYLRLKHRIKDILKNIIRRDCAYICRVPGTLGNLAIEEFRKHNIKYAIEVVGDPQDSLSYTATHKILPALLSKFSAKDLRRNARYANAALYVTKETLQKRYPVQKEAFSIGVSDVVVDTNMRHEDIKPFPNGGLIRLLAVGSLEQMYKSPDIVLKALVKVKQLGIKAHLTWLGDGKYKQAMINLAHSIGIGESVSFVGNVSKMEVNEYLRKSDVYIQASRTEGLPRALVEAMAVGLPCIGTRVGGIPELVSESYLMNVNDYKRLAEILYRFANDKEYVNIAKEENFKKALAFNTADLKDKRNKFFNAVKMLY